MIIPLRWGVKGREGGSPHARTMNEPVWPAPTRWQSHPTSPKVPRCEFVLLREPSFRFDMLISQLAFLHPCLLSFPSGVSGPTPESGRINNTKVWSVSWMDVSDPESGFHFPDKKAPGGSLFLIPSDSFRGKRWKTRRKKGSDSFIPAGAEGGKQIRSEAATCSGTF